MRLLILFSIVLTVLYACSTPTALVELRQEKPEPLKKVAAIGLPGNMVHDERSGFHYNFEYDRNNLYINLAAEDPNLVSKIAFFGLTVWIDREGDRNREQGFRFPMPARVTVAPREEARTGQQPGRTGGGTQRTGAGTSGLSTGYLLDMAEYIELMGIYGTSTRKVNTRDSRIRVTASMVDNIFVYEAVVPYEMLGWGYNPLAAGGRMSIGLETGYYDPPSPSRQAPAARRPDGGLGQPGRMPGQYPGRYPGQYPMPDQVRTGQRTGPLASLSRPSRLWVKLEFSGQAL